MAQRLSEDARRFLGETALARSVLTAWRWLGKLAEGLSLIVETAALLCLGSGVLMQLYAIVQRNADPHHVTALWINDASTLVFVAGAFLYVARTRLHVGFSGLPRMLGREVLAKRIDLIMRPVVVAVLFFLAYEGIQLVLFTIPFGGLYSPEFAVPLSAFYAIAPVTFAVCGLSWLTRPAAMVAVAPDEAPQPSANATKK